MSLSKTVPLIEAYNAPLATQLTSLSEAVDEILTARLGGYSWLAFTSNPQLELGDVYAFGTITNFSYQPSQYSEIEFPIAPTGGQVLSYNSASKYVSVTGMPDQGIKTLNRKYYNWRSPLESVPSKWWAKYDFCERFERLGVADILIQNYTDPTAGNNTTFTWKSHWDRHGCIRIHNGNRFDITWTDSTSSVVIPAYGVKCARRLTPYAQFTWSNNYIHKTYQGDETTWDAEHPGQVAGCVDRVTSIVDGMSSYCRFNAEPDSDSTSREKASFTNTDILGTDYLFDWMYHRGDVLSVVTELSSGTSSITPLHWNGLTTGFTPTGHITHDYSSGYSLTLTTNRVNPNWMHHLVPKSTNILSSIVEITNQPHNIYTPVPNVWNHLQSPKPYGSIRYSTGRYKKPYYPYENGDWYYEYNFSPRTLPAAEWSTTVVDVFPYDAPSAGAALIESNTFKTSDAIGKSAKYEISPTALQVGIDSTVAESANFSGSTIKITGATHLGLLCSRRRFLPRQVRKYQTAGRISAGAAVFDQHPQDFDVTGSLDQEASGLSLIMKEFGYSDMQIEDTDWTTTRPVEGEKTYYIGRAVGTWLHIPTNVIHYVLENIETPGWWYNNFDALLNNYAVPNWQLLTWRIPRLIEEYNDLAKCINNVKEVLPVQLEELYKNPLPGDMRVKPWKFYAGEYGYTVPYDWIAGYNNLDGRFTAWCNAWSITPRTIDISSYRNELRYVFREKSDYQLRPVFSTENTASFIYGMEQVPYTEVDYNGNYIDSVANGMAYARKFAIRSAQHERILFGSAGKLDKYRYVTKTDLDSAFSFLPNLVTGYRDGGYRYEPTIETPTSLTLRVGTLHGDPDKPSPITSNFWYDCQTYYRSPDTNGTWVETIEHLGRFRLMDFDGGSEYTIKTTQPDPSVDEHVSPGYNLVWNIDTTAEAKKYGEFPDGNIRFNSYSPNKLLPIDSSGYRGWRQLPSFTADYPVTLICSAEPYFRHDYVDPWPEVYNSDPFDIYSTVSVSAIPTYVRTVSTSDYPITVDKLNNWFGPTLDCWHVQIVKHTGVLRN